MCSIFKMVVYNGEENIVAVDKSSFAVYNPDDSDDFYDPSNPTDEDGPVPVNQRRVGYTLVNNIDDDFGVYSNNPFGNGTYDTMVDGGEEVAISSFGLKIYKYNEDKEPLSGAKFEIYSDKELTNLIGTVVTDDKGIGEFKGIGGDVYLKEVKAPTGYRLLKDIIYASGVGARQILTIESSNSIDDNILEVDVADSYDNGWYPIEIINQEAGLLPITGGIGIVIFSVLGLVIISFSTYLFIQYRKNRVVIN